MDKQYWTERYQNKQTGWDVGYPTPPISTFFDSITDKTVKILIPGAGNAHEASYLWKNGFENIYICDISPKPIDNFKKRHSDFPENQLICKDFFMLNEKFDVIIEQTFFCAIPHQMRKNYAIKQVDLLKDSGYIVGVMFNILFEKKGPPFGGSIEEYKGYFTPHFHIDIMEPCYNSIPPRAGTEVFVKLRKK